MGDEDGGLLHLPLEPHKLVLHVPAYEGVQGAERLVHQQDFRVAGQCSGQADALLHAAGQSGGPILAPLTKPHKLQDLLGPL